MPKAAGWLRLVNGSRCRADEVSRTSTGAQIKDASERRSSKGKCGDWAALLGGENMNRKSWLVMSTRRLLKIGLTLTAFVVATAHQAFGFTITDTVGDKFLVTGLVISAKTPGLFQL